MTVKELKNILKKCNDEDLVKIQLIRYSMKKESIIDTTYEDPTKAIYEIYIDSTDDDTLLLNTTLYDDWE